MYAHSQAESGNVFARRTLCSFLKGETIMGKKGHFQASWHRERGPKRAPYTGPEGSLDKRNDTSSAPDPEWVARKARIAAVRQQSSDKAMVIDVCSGPINIQRAT